MLSTLSAESGATAIEYGLIAAGIAIAIVPALNGVGSSLKVKFTTISTSLKGSWVSGTQMSAIAS